MAYYHSIAWDSKMRLLCQGVDYKIPRGVLIWYEIRMADLEVNSVVVSILPLPRQETTVEMISMKE